MERRNRNILIVLIAAVIAVAVFSSFGLSLFAAPTPEIVLPDPVPTATAGTDDSAQGGGVRVDVTPKTVQSVIAAIHRLDSYSRAITTTLSGAVTSVQVWVDGGWTRSDVVLPSGTVAHTIVGDGTVWRWYNTARTVKSWPADGASADGEGQHIPTYEDVLSLDPGSITAAGYETRNGVDCVYVEVENPAGLAQTERYWVSADNGLLVGAETETGGEVVYSMTAGTPEIPVSSVASFTLPDGTVLHSVE